MGCLSLCCMLLTQGSMQDLLLFRISGPIFCPRNHLGCPMNRNLLRCHMLSCSSVEETDRFTTYCQIDRKDPMIMSFTMGAMQAASGI